VKHTTQRCTHRSTGLYIPKRSLFQLKRQLANEMVGIHGRTERLLN